MTNGKNVVTNEHGIKKIEAYFDNIKKRGQNLFIPYIVAGDGGLDVLVDRIKLLEKSGVAAIELGIPFSDPVADGPTIQRAGMRAIRNGVTLKSVLALMEETKAERNVPIIFMTYFNPVFVYGIEDFVAACQRAGVDGVIIPDVPMEEEFMIADALKRHHIAFIRLVAMTSTKERKKKLAEISEGFLYAVSVTGTTGARANHDEKVGEYLRSLKHMSKVPVLAGFGVSNHAQARRLSSFCDGVIVGSKIVDLFHEGKDDEVRRLIEQSL